ncbi:hypothetical protein DYB25_000869 [Aphanomyces astaci]|uniref:ABC transporter domain-containing protein n=1 Tax=Aphanomyces astaci TaxID=112090 RepID=A0A397B4A5_APHAT|nr:hypothetical protein DYB25_000869 [Aphanomyces astaci]
MQLWTEPKRIMLGTFVYPDPDTTIGYVMISVGVLSAAVGYVLGPPQCVKAAFLKTLAGVFYYKGGGTLSPHISGSVSYNGLSPRDIHVEDIATFVGQTDEHIPTLTVLETFEFTDACRGPSNSTKWQRSTPAMVHALGLATCAHTRMGNAMIRGISGEQRRRVSVGQMMTGQTPLLLLDEFTTGMDTTVALNLTTKLWGMCTRLQYTLLCSLLQPPPGVFALFDNILLLNEGPVCYFGPRWPACRTFTRSALSYSLAVGIVELPYVAFNSTVFVLLFLPLYPTPDTLGWFFGLFFGYSLYATYLGQFVATMLPAIRTVTVVSGSASTGALAPNAVIVSQNVDSVFDGSNSYDSRYQDIIVDSFLETLKTQGATGPPTEICVSGLTWRKATSGGREFDLFDVTARLKVGSMTLVLGPPGCGKTSLLKAIAGVFPTAPLHVSGSVAYNGIPTARLPSGELRHLVTFAGQKDEHIPTLTVHETLKFAHACRSYDGSTLNTADGTDAIIDMLGLTGCQHTLVGDDLVRGVSGGQRRRVTLGEMLTGRSPVLLLDEYTTGLDTTVATDITQKLRDMCMALQYTAVAALLQPPPEVFALFDNVLILTEGHLAYFGPATYAVDFFQSLGFQRPPNTDDADFLQEVTSMHGWAFKDPNMLRVAPSSDEQPPPPSTPPSGAPQSCRHRRSSFQIVRRVFQRQFKLVSRDTKFNMIRFGQSIVMGSAIGSLFGKLGYDPPNVPSKIGLMFLTLLFTSVTTLANIAYTIQKQALFQLYPAWAYAAAESVIEMLCTAFQVFLFTVTTYWMCEFSPTNHGDQYGVYYAIIFLNSACVTQVFKCIAAFAPSAVSGLILGAAVCFILIIFSGFAIPGPSVPSYFVWLFNINPGSWAFWAVMLNEYQSSLPEYDTMHIKLPLRMGDYYVQLYGIPVESKYVGWAIVYLGGVYIGLAGLTAIGYRFVRYRKQYVSKARRQVDLVPSAVATKNASSTTTSFVPVTLTFQDLHYSIPVRTSRRTILTTIS